MKKCAALIADRVLHRSPLAYRGRVPLARAGGIGVAISIGLSISLLPPAVGLLPPTAMASATPASPHLVFAAQPVGAAVGAPFGTQPSVDLEDASNQVVASSSSVTLTLSGPGGTALPSGPTLTCDQAANSMSAVNGVAAFTGCTVSIAGVYSLTATDSADSLTQVSADFLMSSPVSSADPASLAFKAQPTGGAGGSLFGIQPKVAVEDAGGNVTNHSDQITLSIAPDTGTAGAILSCSTNPLSAVGGLASFSGCAIDRAGTGYQLVATDAARSVTSTPFNVSTGGAAHIAFRQEPSGGEIGAAFLTQPVVTLTDAGGEAVPGSVALSASPAGSSASGGAPGFSCDANPVVVVSGTATFSGCRDTTIGTFTLTAASGSLTVTSSPFFVFAGSGGSAVANMSFTTEPGGGTGGAPWSSQPVVSPTDAGGNPATGSVSLSITSGTGTPGAVLTCLRNTVAVSGDAAAFSGCSIDKAGTGYTLTASSGAVTVTSKAFSVAVGVPDQLAFRTQPGGGTGGTAWAAQPIVTVEDAGGNQVPTSTASVALSVTPATGTGILHCDATSLPAVRGAAIFSGCSIDKVASAYTVTAQDAADALLATSAPFAVAAGQPSQLLFTAQPSGGIAGMSWTTQPIVTVADAGGNVASPDTADTVALAISPGTGTAAARLSCGATSRPAVGGAATFSGCSIDKAAGGYTLVATDSAHGLQSESLPFPELLGPPSPLGVAPTGIPLAQTFGGSLYGRNPTAVTDDVNSATGSLTFGVTDLRVAGIGKPLLLQRTYNSADPSGGAFGRGWSSLLDVSLVVIPQQTATLRGEDGQTVVFAWDAVSKRWGRPGARAALSCTAKQCTVSRFDGVTMHLNLSPNGRWQLSDFSAPGGQGLAFAWGTASVTITVDTTNVKPYLVRVALGSNGHVTGVTTPGGRSVSYGYTGDLLSSVTDVRGGTWAYAYTGGRLTTETDPDHHVRLTATYDSIGRVAHVSAQGSPQHTDDTFTYDLGTTTRRALINGNGSVVRALYIDQYQNDVLLSQTTPWGGVSRYSYDARLNLIEQQGPTGWVEQLQYDADNNLVSQSTPITATSSSTVTMTYDHQHRLLTQTDADGNTTQYVYNGPYIGQIRQPGPGGTPGTQLTYNGTGELVQAVTPVGQQLYTYDAAGNQASVVSKDLSGNALNGPGTRTSYDEAGDVLSRTDANGNNTTYTYDPAGNLLTKFDPARQTTTNTYDASGDPASVTDSGGNMTAYSWDESTLTRASVTRPAAALGPVHPSTELFDPSGDLLVEANASLRTSSHTIDPFGREIAMTDPSNLTVRYSYDVEGNVVAMSDSTGDVITQQFDSLNRMIRRLNNGKATLTGYDPNGNVVSSTDPAGSVTTTAYTARGKPASVTNAAGTTTYAYDAVDDLVTTTDPGGRTTSSTYDGSGRQTSTSANGNTTSMTYDNNGNLKMITDPDGRTTTNTYDALNRSTATTYSWSGHPSLTVTQSYDGLGRRIGMSGADGAHSFSYDAAGDLTSATSQLGTFRYDYSSPGKISETYPDGTVISYSVDDQQHLMNVEAGTAGTAGYVGVSYSRNQLRTTTGISFSNGVLETDSVNRDGQILDQSLQVAGKQVAHAAVSYDGAGNPLSQVETALGGTTTNTYSYDGTERLTGFASSTIPATNSARPAVATAGTPPLPGSPGDPSGFSTAPVAVAQQPVLPSSPTAAPAPFYSYDGSGNLLSSGPVASTYNAANQLVSRTTGGALTTFTYDRSGDLVSSTAPGGAVTSYTYDAAAHLVSVTTPSATISYTYDGDGNRTSKSVGSNVTLYSWDTKGAYPRLALETNPDKSLIRRYIYGDGPVAMQTPSATYFYHLDAQGSVAELSDATGAIVAAYTYDGYGKVNAVGSAAPANPLLFQGQFLDTDTGLYDMRARNYDPVAGRFTQKDPVSTALGAPAFSPYAFANDRPTVFADPTGRTTSNSDTHDFASSIASSAVSSASTPISGTQSVTTGKVASTAMKPAMFVLSKATAYLVKSIRASLVTAADQLASSAGEIAEATSEVAADTGAGWLGAEEGESSGKFAKISKFLGPVALVAGMALGAYITVEACEHGSVATCVGDAVGTIVGSGLAILCTVESAGVAAVGCGIAAGIISAGLTEIISRYGPEIADGVVSLYNDAAAGVDSAVAATTQALVSAADSLSEVATSVGGAIATGFNEATTAISSGYQSVLSTLVQAGYSAAQLAAVLSATFQQGLTEAVGALVSFGYSIGDVATAAFSVFSTTAVQTAALLKDGFNYAAAEIGGALKDAYNLADEAAASVLKGVNFAVDEVATALESAYNDAAATVASVLNDLSYGVTQIGAALQQVFNELDGEVASALHTLGFAVDQVATALVGLYDEAASAVAKALDVAAYAVSEIATAMNDTFQVVGQVAASILKTLDSCAAAPVACVVSIAGALKSVYDFADEAAAQVLETVGFAVNDVAHALSIAYIEAADAVASALRNIGNTVDQVATALSVVFSAGAQDAALILEHIGYSVSEIATALQDTFSELAGAAAAILRNIGEAAAEVATALEGVFGEAVGAVGTILADIGFSNDVIQGIGGAFVSFGNAVADCFDSGFTNC